jgi:DNA-binding NarL/FixJ family response regulator
MPTQVLIVDDHPVLREGLTVYINTQPDLAVCGQAADTCQAMKMLEANRPDVVVVDIQLTDGNGLDLAERIKAHDKTIQVLVYSNYHDSLYTQRALQAGASGYINKRHEASRLVEAIRRVLHGGIFLSEETADLLLTSAVGGRRQLRACGIAGLTNRELDIFRLVGQGLTTSRIAETLQRSVHTVEAHRTNIKEKLGLKTAAELSRSAVQWVLEYG